MVINQSNNFQEASNLNNDKVSNNSINTNNRNQDKNKNTKKKDKRNLTGMARYKHLMELQDKRIEMAHKMKRKLKRNAIKRSFHKMKEDLHAKTTGQIVRKVNTLLQIRQKSKQILKMTGYKNLDGIIHTIKVRHQKKQAHQSRSTGSSSNIDTIGYAPVDADQKDSDSSANTSNSTDSSSASNTDTSNVTSPSDSENILQKLKRETDEDEDNQ